ncbi:unnamed protein product [Prorocentrum cordatum]|uniref:Uncharacterized protein n=1 Tax=Prorocentrum cordatum TaxID=2364126 RepID=A0ABN9SXW4_9DINO|nr:unnamed protein product [Polarella glacialis]
MRSSICVSPRAFRGCPGADIGRFRRFLEVFLLGDAFQQLRLAENVPGVPVSSRAAAGGPKHDPRTTRRRGAPNGVVTTAWWVHGDSVSPHGFGTRAVVRGRLLRSGLPGVPEPCGDGLRGDVFWDAEVTAQSATKRLGDLRRQPAEEAPASLGN